MSAFDEYKSAAVEWMSSGLATHLLPFALVALDCLAGAALGPGRPREITAGLALVVAFAFAWRFETVPRLLLLAFAACCSLLAFGRGPALTVSGFSSILALAGLPAIMLHLLMGLSRRRHPLIAGLRLYHLYGPMAAIVFAEILRADWMTDNASLEKFILLVYWLYTGILLFFLALGFLSGLTEPQPAAHTAEASDLESEGKFTLAGRRYSQEGDFAKGGQMAQKAGDWLRAGEMYARVGDFFNAAEMYYRGGALEEALVNYERSGTPAAAARICMELGRTERASELLAKCGEYVQAVDVLEKDGKLPAVGLYLKAGRFEKAVAMLRAQGDLERAAEITEHELHDPGGAATLYQLAGAPRKAGELLEALGRKSEAIEAYSKSPDTALHAAQLCYDSGELIRAKLLLEKHAGEDEQALLLLARIHWQEHKVDDAIRVLQKLKRGTDVAGSVPYLLGRCFMTKGMPELAEPELRVARTLALVGPEQMDAGYYLARVLEVLGKPGEALEIYQEIVRKDFHYRDAQARYMALKQGAHVPGLGSAESRKRFDDFDA